MLSIIIPTLNEEKHLPLLLESVKKQKFSDYEIIVADAGSKDKTVEIAKKYECKIISGGLPAKGRNEGAKISKGEILFFLDADTVLPNNFFDEALLEFKERKLDAGSFCLIPLPKNKMSSFFLNVFYNQPAILLENALPHAATGIIMTRDVFEKSGGFDENVKLAEDHYLIRRLKELFNIKFGIFRSTYIFISDRRFRTDGWLAIGAKFLLCELHMIFLGPVRSNIFKYKFNHYDENKK